VKRVLLIALAVVVGLVALGYGAYARYYAIHYVSTGDAYVDGAMSTVSARITGHVVELLVDDNKPVKRGDLLLWIDARDYRAKVDQARAAVAMAESGIRAAAERVKVTREMAAGQVAQAHASTLAAESSKRSAEETLESNKAIVASRQAALGAARADRDRSQALLERANQERDRLARLVKQGLVAQRDCDRAVSDAKSAEAALRAAEQRVTQAEGHLTSAEADLRMREAGFEGTGIGLGWAAARVADAGAKQIQAEAMYQEVRVRDAEHDLAMARLQQAQAQLELAELQLSYTGVRAALDGVVAKRTVEVGQMVQPGQPLMAIVPLHDLWVIANFQETQLGRVRPGMRAEVIIDTFSDRKYSGVVESISAGTGAHFSLLPSENATGNWVKVVQSFPVKIALEGRVHDNPHTLRAGMSAVVTITLR
jgi:membrane fusion protein, multidrug efflux system